MLKRPPSALAGLRRLAETVFVHVPYSGKLECVKLDFTLGKGTSAFAMLTIEMRARFPQFREKLFIKRGPQIAYTFRTTRAAFRSHHTLHHLDVMHAPEREILIMLKQAFSQVKLFEALFEMSQDFQRRPGSFAVAFLTFFFI